jgi:hypothetical protein
VCHEGAPPAYVQASRTIDQLHAHGVFEEAATPGVVIAAHQPDAHSSFRGSSQEVQQLEVLTEDGVPVLEPETRSRKRKKACSFSSGTAPMWASETTMVVGVSMRRR